MIVDFEKAENGTFSEEEILELNKSIKETNYNISFHAIEMFFIRYLNSYASAFINSARNLELYPRENTLKKLIKSYEHFKDIYNLYKFDNKVELREFISKFIKENGEYKYLSSKDKKFYKIRDNKRDAKTLKIVAEPVGLFASFIFIVDLKTETVITAELIRERKDSSELNSTKILKEEVDFFFTHSTYLQDLEKRLEEISSEDYCKYPKPPSNKEKLTGYILSNNLKLNYKDKFLIEDINSLSKKEKNKEEVETLYQLLLKDEKEKTEEIMNELYRGDHNHPSDNDIRKIQKKAGTMEIRTKKGRILNLDINRNMLTIIENKNSIPYLSSKARKLLELDPDVIRGVQIIILNDEGKMLIAKRSKFKKNGEVRIGAERWNFIGGKLDENELPEDAAKRETFEESGINIEDVIFLHEGLNPWDPLYDPFHAYLYATQITKETEIILNDEHTEYKFVSLSEIDDYNLLGYNRDELSDIILI